MQRARSLGPLWRPLALRSPAANVTRAAPERSTDARRVARPEIMAAAKVAANAVGGAACWPSFGRKRERARGRGRLTSWLAGWLAGRALTLAHSRAFAWRPALRLSCCARFGRRRLETMTTLAAQRSIGAQQPRAPFGINRPADRVEQSRAVEFGQATRSLSPSGYDGSRPPARSQAAAPIVFAGGQKRATSRRKPAKRMPTLSRRRSAWLARPTLLPLGAGRFGAAGPSASAKPELVSFAALFSFERDDIRAARGVGRQIGAMIKLRAA